MLQVVKPLPGQSALGKSRNESSLGNQWLQRRPQEHPGGSSTLVTVPAESGFNRTRIGRWNCLRIGSGETAI